MDCIVRALFNVVCCLLPFDELLLAYIISIKALVRSKKLTALPLNFCKTLRSRSKRFERRSNLRSF